MHDVKLLLTGDVMTGRGIDQVLAHPGDPALHEPWVRDARDYVRLAEDRSGPIPRRVAPGYVWGEALAEMDRRAPQLRIVNLETAVTAAGEPWPGKGIHYRMHPDNITCLQAARLDACVLANNHVLDWGAAGLVDTLRVLREGGIACAGAGVDEDEALRPAALPLPGGSRLLVHAFCIDSSGVLPQWQAGPGRSGVARLAELSDEQAAQIAARVAGERQPGDLVIVSLHWGGNWGFDLPLAHRRFAHALIDHGAADIVHGHSSHHPLPVEVYRGKLVLYGCGDLINDYEGIEPHGSLRCDVGCLYFATLGRADGRLRRLLIVPLQLRRFRLERADARACEWLARAFNEEGRGLGTQVVVDRASGDWLLRW